MNRPTAAAARAWLAEQPEELAEEIRQLVDGMPPLPAAVATMLREGGRALRATERGRDARATGS